MSVSGISNGKTYTIKVDNHTIESSKLEKYNDNSLKSRFMRWATRVNPSSIIYTTMALTTMTIPAAIFANNFIGSWSGLFIVPGIFIIIGLGLYFDVGLKDKFEKAKDKTFIRWYEFDRIRNLNNYEEIANNYFNKFSRAQIVEFHNNCKRLSSVKAKLEEFEKLSSIMDEKTMFKNDVAEKKKILVKTKEEAQQYFKDLEEKIIQESVDEQVLSAVSLFDGFMSEEMKELMTPEQNEEVEVEVEAGNNTLRR